MVAKKIVFATQFGSGSTGEFGDGDVTSPTGISNVSNSGLNFPSFVAIGSRALQFSSSANQVKIKCQSFVAGTKWSFGFLWLPKTNPSSGNVPLPFPDNGLLTGQCLCWRSADKKLGWYDAVGNVLVSTLNTAPDTAESYGGDTNPSYWIAYAVDTDLDTVTVFIYKCNENTQTFDLIEVNTTSYTSGTTAQPWIGTAGPANTGEYYVTNVMIQSGINPGHPMPIAPNMITKPPTSQQTDNTNLVPADGSGNSTTNEWNYVKDLGTVDDTTASYLTASAGGAINQYFGVGSGDVDNQNIIGACVFNRFWTDTDGTTVTSAARIGTAASNYATFSKNLTGANLNVWIYIGIGNSYTTTNGNIGLTPSDIDNTQIQSRFQRFGGEVRTSQCFLVVVYGRDVAQPNFMPFFRP